MVPMHISVAVSLLATSGVTPKVPEASHTLKPGTEVVSVTLYRLSVPPSESVHPYDHTPFGFDLIEKSLTALKGPVPVPLKGIWTLAAPWRIAKYPVRVPVARGLKNTLTCTAGLGRQTRSAVRVLVEVAPIRSRGGKAERIQEARRRRPDIGQRHCLRAAGRTHRHAAETERGRGKRQDDAAAYPLAVPLRGSLCGLPGALSQMVTAPDLVPAEVGENVTLSVQEAPAAKVVGQLLPS